MTLQEDVKYIENRLDQTQSVEQLRTLLAQKRLKLVVVLISKDSTCMESLETVHSEPIRVKEENWVDLDDLFKILKKGIAICIKKATIAKK